MHRPLRAPSTAYVPVGSVAIVLLSIVGCFTHTLRPGASSVSMVPGSAQCGTARREGRERDGEIAVKEPFSEPVSRFAPSTRFVTMEGEGGPDRQVVYLPTYRTGPSESDKYVSGETCGGVDA